MHYHILYAPEDKMISLISDDYRLIQVLSRFGIPLGFGDMTVSEVCQSQGVDCNTFLSVVNFIIEEQNNTTDFIENVRIESLLHYLHQSHLYFLEFLLPSIRRKLLAAIQFNDYDVSFLILKLFDEYTDEIKAHMEEEENQLFKYIALLINNETKEKQNFATYSEHHDKVASKLTELKKIILKYCPSDSRTNLLNDALYDIYRCEEELLSHCRIEDHILVPAIQNLESKI